jgi:hypothetical protein
MPNAKFCSNSKQIQPFSQKISDIYSDLLQAISDVDSTIGLKAQPDIAESLRLLLRTIRPLYEASISSGPALREMRRAIRAMEGHGGSRASHESFNIICDSLAETLNELEDAVTSEPKLSEEDERWLILDLPVFSSYLFTATTWTLLILCMMNKTSNEFCVLSFVAFTIWAMRTLYENGLRLPILSLDNTTQVHTRVHLCLPDHLTVDILIIVGFAFAFLFYPAIPAMAYVLLLPASLLQVYRTYRGTGAECMKEYTAAQVVRLQQHIRLYVDMTRDVVLLAHRTSLAVEQDDVSPTDELSTLKAFRHYLSHSALDYKPLSALMQREQFIALVEGHR